MNELIKYHLEFDKAFNYTKKGSKDSNTLSSTLLHTVDFEKGKFFTLLPDDSNLERLYEFEAGVILPQNPVITRYSKDGLANSYSITPTITDELAELIFKLIKKEKDIFCIFDDIIRDPTEEYDDYGVIKGYKYLYGQEVYYLLDSDNISSENIKHCLNASYAFWHSLCILTSSKIEINSTELTQEIFHEICLHAQLILVGAYDGEGYVFWERNGTNFFSN